MPLNRALGSFTRRTAPRRRTLRVLGGVASLGFGAVILLGVAVYARLSAGPIALDGLSSRLEAAIAGHTDDLTLGFDGVAIALGRGDPPIPGLYLRALSLRQADGRLLATADRARIGLDPLALLVGRVAVRTLDVAGAEVAVPAPGTVPGGLVAALLALLSDTAPALLARLDRVTVEGATLHVAPGPLLASRTISEADLVLRRRHDRIALRADLPLDPAGARLLLEGEITRDGRAVGEAALSGADLDVLASLHPSFAPLSRHSAPFEAALRIEMAPGHALAALALDAALGPGWLELGDARLALAEAALRARLDPASGRVEIDRLVIDTAMLALSGTGIVEVDALRHGAPAGTPLRPVVHLDLTHLRASPPGTGAGPVRFDRGGLLARLDPDGARIEIADLWLEHDATRLRAEGVAAAGGAAPSLALDLSGEAIDADMLMALWPSALAPPVRVWVAENLVAGRIVEVAAALRGPASDPAFGLSFGFEEVETLALPTLPTIAGASGWAGFDGTAFAVTLATGHVDVPGGGRLDLAGSSLRVPDAAARVPMAEIAITGAGPVASLLRLIDMPPLALLARGGLDAGFADGTVQVRADLSLPLLVDLPADAVSADIVAAVRDATVRLPGLPEPIAVSAMDLTADSEGLVASGSASTAGLSGRFTLTESFAAIAGGSRGTVRVETSLTAADARRLGLPAGDPWIALSGRMPLTLEIDRRSGTASPFDARLDLREAAVAAPVLAWAKPAGVAGALVLEGVLAEGGGVSRLDRIALDAPGLRLRGSARLGRDGALDRLDIASLRVDGAADLSARLSRDGAGFALSVEGAHLSLEGFGAQIRQGRDAAVPLGVVLDLDALDLAPGVRLARARGRLDRDRSGALGIVLSGTLGAGASVDARVDLDADGRGRLRIESADAGEVLRGAGLFRRGVGGGLTLLADLGDGPMQGEALITDFVVGSHPAIERALADADLDAALDRLRGEGLRFERVRAPFRWHGDRLALDEAVAYGPVLGLSLSGEYLVAEDELMMQGVLTPLYGLNSLIGAVPVIGPLLTGGAGQGVIAFTFNLGGPAAEPRVQVNPFSALLPGVLRQIMQARPVPR